ncbi:MAG: DUF4402 domain-containing protein [bacterium]|nr:DUF4402 domain-containing protein [bacterium]
MTFSKSLLMGLMAAMVMAPSAYATDEPFLASITIFSPITITETSALSFGSVSGAATNQNVVVAPSDPGAASFNLAGESNLAVTATIVEPSLALVNGATTITVNGFTFGGALASNGTANLGALGKLNAATVGATAAVPANPTSGTYSGNLTLRVVYQ